MALAQMRRATRPITAYSGSTRWKEERQIRRKIVDVHAPGQVVFDKGKPIGQRKRQLRDGVGARFGDMVTRNRYRVKVSHVMPDEILLHIAHQPERKLGRKMQVFCAWSSLRISACTVPLTADKAFAFMDS